jgi:inosose dehydratase
MQVSPILPNSQIGIVPLNWKYDSTQKTKFLDGIASYGYTGIQISGEQALSAEFLDLMKERSITSAEQYFAICCDENGPLEGSEVASTETIAQAAAAGVQMLVIAVDGSADRDRCAGRADSGPQLSDVGFRRLADQVGSTARAAAAVGISSSFHPHAATYIESESETQRLFDLLDMNLVGMCLDVGHWIVGGGDPIAAVKIYGSHITHVHVKDVSPEVLTKLLSGELETMNSAVEDFKLFVPAGTGLLKMSELFHALNAISYAGWLMSEQDSAWEPAEAASGVSMSNIKLALL